MTRTMKKLVAIGLALGVVVGCGARLAPVHNIDSADVVASTSKNVSADQVRTAIKRAGAGLGWVIKDADDNKLVGILHLRKHVAKIDIDYSSKSYSIRYKDSQNLNYDGNLIHRNYNNWILNLQRRINVELSML